MSIKILLLRSNEEIITEAQEIDDPETKEKREWCAEYHPGKSSAECSKIAGW